MRRLMYKILGGRPMHYESFAFTDVVSGKPVNVYIDRLGRCFLAESRWSLFRVPKELS